MATYVTHFPGNVALQQDVWTLTIAEAQAAAKYLDTRSGTYWGTTLMSPLRRAMRAKADRVTVYTAGFSSGEFSNVLYASGSTITQ